MDKLLQNILTPIDHEKSGDTEEAYFHAIQPCGYWWLGMWVSIADGITKTYDLSPETNWQITSIGGMLLTAVYRKTQLPLKDISFNELLFNENEVDPHTWIPYARLGISVISVLMVSVDAYMENSSHISRMSQLAQLCSMQQTILQNTVAHSFNLKDF